MSANWEQQVRAKTITAAQWADMVKCGDWIYTGGPGSDPIASIESLCPRLGDGHGQLRDIEGGAVRLPDAVLGAAARGAAAKMIAVVGLAVDTTRHGR